MLRAGLATISYWRKPRNIHMFPISLMVGWETPISAKNTWSWPSQSGYIRFTAEMSAYELLKPYL